MTGRPLMILMDNTQTDIITGGSTWNNIHYKYNFIIQPSEIQADISIEISQLKEMELISYLHILKN